jgi:23S rRNA-/tRNA-specific pseudouridylate synthase
LGLLTLPDGYEPSKPHVRAIMDVEYGRVWIVHRLDRETSGTLVLARTAEAHRDLNSQFENRSVEKTYHGLVIGNPAWEEITVELPLRKDGDRNHRTVIDQKDGKEALTSFSILARYSDFSLLEARQKNRENSPNSCTPCCAGASHHRRFPLWRPDPPSV